MLLGVVHYWQRTLVNQDIRVQLAVPEVQGDVIYMAPPSPPSNIEHILMPKLAVFTLYNTADILVDIKTKKLSSAGHVT